MSAQKKLFRGASYIETRKSVLRLAGHLQSEMSYKAVYKLGLRSRFPACQPGPAGPGWQAPDLGSGQDLGKSTICPEIDEILKSELFPGSARIWENRQDLARIWESRQIQLASRIPAGRPSQTAARPLQTAARPLHTAARPLQISRT